MKRSTVAYYALVAVAVVIATTYAIAPHTSETPDVDSSHGAVPAPGAAPQIRESMVGKWVSEDDPAYSVTYSTDGTLTERYAPVGTSTAPVGSTGRWVVMVVDDVVSLGTSVDGASYSYVITRFDDQVMTLRDSDALRDNHFRKVE